MTRPSSLSPSEPRSRFKDPFSGFSHFFGMIAALIGTVALVLTVPHRLSTQTTVLVYGVSLVALFGASSAYHLIRGSDSLDRFLRRLDHCAIFLLIAGTYTPMLLYALEGSRRFWFLTIVWAVAAVGIALRILWLSAPRWLYTAIYLGMGWIGVFQARAIQQALPSTVLALVLAGGLTYTVGAVVYALKRPNFLPGRFGFHELWHLFVLAAAGLHFAAVCVLTVGE